MDFKIGDVIICREPTYEGLGKIYDIETYDHETNFYNVLVVFNEHVYINSKTASDWINSYVWTNTTYLSQASSLERELF
jgi:hypothetical protein